MFKASQLVFYSAVSPVHMGAGQAVGAIDNPIQREVHTGHPLLAGSGLKGAVRHRFSKLWDATLVSRVFGPEPGSSDHAGAVAFSDAALVLFPVRSLRETYVYATAPAALARLKRMAGAAASWTVPPVAEGTALVASDRVIAEGRVVLEAFDFEANADGSARDIAQWLAANVLPSTPEHEFFRNKIQADLVILSDTEFTHFVRHATVVEAHVRIDNDSGTASDGGLFYTENLPPESLLAGLWMASAERRADSGTDGLLTAEQVIELLLQGETGLADALLQVGGDATTGRGILVVHPAGEGV
jgi:CRISPR-associated protein Cmr4